MGRPTKCTPEVTGKVADAIRDGLYAESAATLAGIGERTYYSWMKRGEAGDEPYVQFRLAVKKAEAEAEAAGVPWARFHSLRHGAATAWFAAGIPITVVSALLGHSSAAFTLSIYTHAMPEHMPDGEALAKASGF